MGKNNHDVRASMLQRVDHLERLVESLQTLALELRNSSAAHEARLNSQRQEDVNINRRIDGNEDRLTVLRMAVADHHGTTFGQRLWWLLRGQR